MTSFMIGKPWLIMCLQ